MDSTSSGVFAGIFAGIMTIYFLVILGVYILGCQAYYKLYKKAGIKSAWLAWIPIANLWPYMWVIKKSAWNILWLLLPVANLVFGIIWMVKFYKAYGMNPHYLWLMLVPYVGGLIIFVQLCYMGFSSKVQYQLDSASF